MHARAQRAVRDAMHPRATLAIILVCYFMILLDNSVIFTALPSLKADLHLGAGELSWVQDAYTLVFGGLLLLGSRAGDLLGRRRVFVFGLAVFSVASLLVGVAPAGWWAIAARALQGVGAAVVAPSSLSLLTASFPEGRPRSRAVAWYGATAGIGASLGLLIGGALTQWVSWRAGFFVNLPIGAGMIILAPRYLPETSRSAGRFDLTGAVTATAGIGLIVFSIINTTQVGWGSPVTLGAISAGVALLAVFVINERRAAQPIMPLRLLKSTERVGAYLARFFYLGAMIGFFYFCTQFMQDVLGMTPLQAGLGFLPMTAVNFAVAMCIPRLIRRLGGTIPLVAGIVVTLAGMAWLSRLTVDSGYLTGLAAPMVLVGVGQGLSFAPLTSAGIAGATERDAGAASGLVNTFHQVGMAFGLSVLVATSAHAGTGAAGAAARLAAQVSAALTAGSVLQALSLVAALALIVPATVARRRPPANPLAGMFPPAENYDEPLASQEMA